MYLVGLRIYYVLSYAEKNANLACNAVIFVQPSVFRGEILNSSHI